MNSISNNTHFVSPVSTLTNYYNSNNNNDSISSTAPETFIPCDNHRNVLSPPVAETVEFVVYAGIFPVLVTTGVITNVINMAVFAKQGLSNRINVCLFSLAASDTGFLLTMVCGRSYVLMGLLSPELGQYWQQRQLVFCSNLAYLGISNAITAIIALERCLCVVSPLKAARFLRTKYTVALIAATAVYILVVKHAVLALKYQTVAVTDPLTNATTYISRLSAPYLRHRTVLDILYLYSVSVALPCVSLVVIIVCTSVIIFRLKVTSSWREKSMANRSNNDKQEAALTRMLVTVCCVYVMCMTPSVTRVLLLSSLPGFLSTGYLCNVYRVSFALCLLLENVNAVVNFVIYVRQSSQYRAALRAICCCCCRGSEHRTRADGASRASSVTGPGPEKSSRVPNHDIRMTSKSR